LPKLPGLPKIEDCKQQPGQSRRFLAILATLAIDIGGWMKTPKLIWLAVVALALPAWAHVGSPNVYYEGNAGPYHLLVTIRPPAVVPGVAQVEVRSLNAAGDIDKIEILPLTIEGTGESLAPRPDTMQRAADDPQLYTGNLWIMLRGSWKVRVDVEGKQGKSELGVPVAAVSLTAAHMDKGLGLLLGAFGLVLVVGLVSILRAANGPAQVAPKQAISPALKRRAYVGMGIGGGILLVLLVLGDLWWGSEARANERMVYRIPQLQPSLLAGDKLAIRLQNPNAGSFADSDWRNSWAQILQSDDLVPDHGHLMHLFLVRTPDMKSFWHLHPDQTSEQEFATNLPAIPPGHYQIFADIVHSTGFPETQVGTIDLPAGVVAGQPLSGDDSGGAALTASDKTAQLSGGYRMVWERDASSLRAQQAVAFRFRIEDKDGKPAADLENYMGMAGHAVFMSDDGKVFAHVHPEGSVSMAALAMAQGSGGTANSSGTMSVMNMGPKSAEVSFPYGFPQPGDYHIFVQVKRAGHVETGAFVAHVDK
jgi:hypothetical protein